MDHLHQIPGVGPPTNWMLEGNATLAALAARTSKLNLGLLVGGVTYRNPALLAKITTTIDVISGGRAILGIGAAWFEEEHVAYGFDFPPLRERFERLEDALQIIARDVHRRSSRPTRAPTTASTDVLNNPRPIRGDIPIMVGGSGERKTLRMVAQYADARNVFGDAERIRHLIGVLEGHCERLGRDRSEITKTRLGTMVIATTHEQAQAKLNCLRHLAGATSVDDGHVGDPDKIAEQASALLDAGLDALIFNMPDVHDLETVALVGETLGPCGARARTA